MHEVPLSFVPPLHQTDRVHQSAQDMLVVLVHSTVVMVLTYGILRWDQGHPRTHPLRRYWNGATVGVAVVFFSPWCLLVYFPVTRGLLRGIPWGLLATVFVVLTDAAVVELLVRLVSNVE